MIIGAGPVFNSRLSRLRYRIQSAGMTGLLGRAINGPFAVVSASSDGDDRALRELLVESGYGFYRLFGLFAFAGPSHVLECFSWNSLIVPAMPHQAAKEYSQACGSDCYLWATRGRWRLARTATDDSIAGGDVTSDFRLVCSPRARMPEADLQVWCLPKGPVSSDPGQYWVYCLQIDHFSPPVGGPPLFGILQEGEEGASWFSPALCDALVPLSG